MDESRQGRREGLSRLLMFAKRRLKLNRFLLVIDTKKGVSISAVTVIVAGLIDLLWNLSMTFGPLSSTMTGLLLVETLLVVFVSSMLLYAMKSDNKSDLRSILFTWLVVVAIDYALRASMALSVLAISQKASTSARVMKSIVSAALLALVAHCWLCVYTFYDDNNGKMTTVKITPSDDRGRLMLNKRPIMMMNKTQPAASSGGGGGGSGGGGAHDAPGADRELAANMLRAPTEDATKSRW